MLDDEISTNEYNIPHRVGLPEGVLLEDRTSQNESGLMIVLDFKRSSVLVTTDRAN